MLGFMLGQAAATPSLTSTQGYVVLGLIVCGCLLAGWVVVLARDRARKSKASEPQAAGTTDEPIVRSWLAIALVLGLLVFCGAAFLIGDTTLRSTLIGGLVASSGAAVAFYFSSKSADKARADILTTATTLSGADSKPTHFVQESPHEATVGHTYIDHVKADGQPAPEYELIGKLPDGIELDPDGTLYGAPTEVPNGDAPEFTVRATNRLGSATSDKMKITVAAAGE